MRAASFGRRCLVLAGRFGRRIDDWQGSGAHPGAGAVLAFWRPGRGDSASGRAGSHSELPMLPARPQPWPKVSIVIPTLNEARDLPHVFAKLPAGLHEVMLVR
jgi:hypothetical protein